MENKQAGKLVMPNMTLSYLLNCFSKMRKKNKESSEREKRHTGTCEKKLDLFNEVSLEIICHVLDYLPLRDILKMECQCKRIQKAVAMHLKIRKSINFTEGEIHGWIPSSLNDTMLLNLVSRCDELESIYGFHSCEIIKRRQRGTVMLTIPGIVAALSSAPKLKGIEISDIHLMEAIFNYLPYIEIVGIFKNRNGGFPINQGNKLALTFNPKITSLHLEGVVLPELPRLNYVKHLHLRWVKFTHSHPFRDFSVPFIQTFVMSNCVGPISTLKYVPLVTGLAAARSLTRLELVRVPFLGGLFQHIVEDSWRVNGFSNLQTATFAACKHAQEVDLGYLMITAAQRLEELSIQPSLTKDSLFSAIKMAGVSFPSFDSLHLGYTDAFPEPGQYSEEELVLSHGLAEVSENPAMMTDIGMKATGKCFPLLRNLEIYNCPHLHYPTSWMTSGAETWSHLRHLHLRRCHAIRLQDFCRFIELLPQLELLHLELMFREPPKGCARVGLSAGTGLGVSSALVQNSGNDIVQVDGGHGNQGNQDNNNNINHNNNNPHGAAAHAADLGDANHNNRPGHALHMDDDLFEDSLDEEDFEDFSDFSDFEMLSDESFSDDNDGLRIVLRNEDKDNSSPRPSAALDLGAKDREKPDSLLPSNHCEPSTSKGSSGCSSSKCKQDKPVIPSVDTRSTCQLVDIDIGSDSDSDHNVECPAEGKIKVKVDCSNTMDPTKDERNAGIRHSKGKKRMYEDPVSSTSNVGCPMKNVDGDKKSYVKEEAQNCNAVPRASGHPPENWTVSDLATEKAEPARKKRRSCSHESKPDKDASVGKLSDPCTSKDVSASGSIHEQQSSRDEDQSTHQAAVPAASVSDDAEKTIEKDHYSGIKMEKDSVPNQKQSQSGEEKDLEITGHEKDGSQEGDASITDAEQEADVKNRDADPKPSTSKAGTSGAGTSQSSKAESQEEPDFLDELLAEFRCNSPQPDVGPWMGEDGQMYLFSPAEMEEMGFGKQNQDDEDISEECEEVKSYNMRPRKGGKSLSGKKKGLVKKQKSNGDSKRLSTMRNKSCQAVSDEIRETTKRAKEQEDAHMTQMKIRGGSDTPKVRTRSQTVSHSQRRSATSSFQEKAGAKKRKKNMKDKATSTSDPVIEDDHIQILTLKSKSLVCVTLHKVGVTNIYIDDCPNLSVIRGSACRVLKKVTIESAPKLSKISFAQCRKLDNMHLTSEVCAQPVNSNKIIFLRPMQELDVFSLEEMLYTQLDIDYHLCVISDYSHQPTETVYNRNRVTAWLDLFSGINMELLRFTDFKQGKWDLSSELDVIGRNVYDLHGHNANGSSWSLSTDVPWLKHLTECPDKDQSNLHPDHLQAGLYCPQRKGHDLIVDCLVDLQDAITEMRKKPVSLHCHTVVVYVEMCDVSGVPAPDFYL